MAALAEELAPEPPPPQKPAPVPGVPCSGCGRVEPRTFLRQTLLGTLVCDTCATRRPRMMDAIGYAPPEERFQASPAEATVSGLTPRERDPGVIVVAGFKLAKVADATLVDSKGRLVNEKRYATGWQEENAKGVSVEHVVEECANEWVKTTTVVKKIR